MKIMKNKWIFIGISIILILASAASLILQGFVLDTDFAGGMAVTYTINADFTTSDIQAIANEALGQNQSPSSVQQSGNDVIIKFGFDNSLTTDEERSDFAFEKITAITAGLEAKYGKAIDATQTEEATEEPTEEAPAEEAPVMLIGQDIVSPSTGKELAQSAIWMSILACIAILLYVTVRFDFASGAVAILALVHDVLILMGIYSILRVSIDTNFIAAILTVLGYSINNTIVIMDRIRENTRHARKETYSQIAEKSVLQTMNRSINTSITTLLTIGMVYILGVPSIQVFALPIIIGIVIGFYSSVFVAGPLWATWKDAGVKK